jgi:predicted DNA-binding protein
VPTRQTSSSGRPKSPRIQVVLPEDLCQRLSLLAEDESRTLSNMAKVLIQQGVERLERLRQQGAVLGGVSEGVLVAGASSAPTSPDAMSSSSPTSAGLPAPEAIAPSATAPPPAVAPPAPPPSAVPPSTSASAPSPAAARSAQEASGSGPVPGSVAAADRFRAELERNEAQGPRRLRGMPRRLRLRPPGG